MPAAGQYVVWEWYTNDDEVVFVGWGKVDKETGQHPAERVWEARETYNSELNRWLLIGEWSPTRYEPTSNVGLIKEEARALCMELRRKYKEEGREMLESRPDNSKSGGGGRRQVLGPALEQFTSVREAAKHCGVNPSTITRWCQTVGNEWDYFD